MAQKKIDWDELKNKAKERDYPSNSSSNSLSNTNNSQSIDWDSLKEKAKENDAAQWETEKNSQKPN